MWLRAKAFYYKLAIAPNRLMNLMHQKIRDTFKVIFTNGHCIDLCGRCRHKGGHVWLVNMQNLVGDLEPLMVYLCLVIARHHQ